jgi:hypothetical protein
MDSKILRSTARPALPIPLLVLGVALFLPVASALPLAACSCVQDFPAGDQPCASYASADAVFVGHVIDVTIRETRPEDEDSFDRKLVTLAVDEAFRGVAGSTVVVRTGMGGGDCGYDFRKGESYFVYASRWSEGGPLGASICGATVRLAYAGRDLDYARRLARGDEIPGIYGAVTRESRKSLEESVDSEPLGGVTVTVTGPGLGREPFRTVTDTQGFFQVVGLLEGAYEVMAEETGIPPVTVEVPAGGRAEASPTASETGRIEGVVLTAAGEPAEDVEVTVLAVGDPDASHERSTDPDGRFELGDLPPGSYLLAINPDGPFYSWDPPYAPLFHPDGADPSEAVPIAVAAGETVTVEPLRLGPPLPTRTLSGRLTRADGQPLGRGQVRIRQPGDEYGGLGAEVDAEGRFTATLFAGAVYVVEGEDWRAGRPNAFAETRVEVWDEDVTVDLVLELPR